MFSFSWTIDSGSTPDTPTPTGTQPTSSTGRDLALNDEMTDLAYVNGDLQIVEGVGSIASDLRARLQTFAGEHFLDTSIGVPYLQANDTYQPLLGSKPNRARNTQMFRDEILGTPGVVELLALDFNFTPRLLSISFRAMTDLNQVIVVSLNINPGAS